VTKVSKMRGQRKNQHNDNDVGDSEMSMTPDNDSRLVVTSPTRVYDKSSILGVFSRSDCALV
jgi:hypothetical protein